MACPPKRLLPSSLPGECVTRSNGWKLNVELKGIFFKDGGN